MKLLIPYFKKYIPLLFLLLVWLVIVAANYVPGTFLMGWDNIMPEFYLKESFMRGLFGVWQEHRGVGLYDGMSHIATLLHTLYIWILSLVFPQSALRYIFQFLCLGLGGFGTYVLIQYLLPKESRYTKKLSSTIGALFAMVNIATVQMFFTPLEIFSLHFAALPWLTWSFFKALRGSRKEIVIFLSIALVTTPQYFVPTLLFPITAILVVASLFFLTTRSLNNSFTQRLKRITILALGFFCVNAFWLLPYANGVPANAPIIQNAKINQMSSTEIFLRNQVFGDLGSVLRLRSFALDFVEFNTESVIAPMMSVWKLHLSNPFINIIVWLLVGFTIVGCIRSIIYIKGLSHPGWEKKSLLFVFIFGILMLGTDIPLLRTVVASLREFSSLFAEVFRFSFTKFGLMFALASTIFLALFVYDLLEVAKKKSLQLLTTSVIILSIFAMSFPIFRGYFFSPLMQVTLPKEYTVLATYLQSKPATERIAVLPQPEYWSWKHYTYGYIGSGFLWYMMPQPLLDRAFDPWSNRNENYYWEISYAIYKKDNNLFKDVLDKYDISTVILDDYITTTNHTLSLFNDQIKELLQTVPGTTQKQFGRITLYEFNKSSSWLKQYGSMPSINPMYQWTENDRAYSHYGSYTSNSSRSDIVYPFRSLFSKRTIQEREYTITESINDIFISSVKNNSIIDDSWRVEGNVAGIEIEDKKDRFTAKISKDQQVALFDTAEFLKAESVTSCGAYRDGIALATNQFDIFPYLRMKTLNERSCLSFGMADMPHRDGYLVAVESRHREGQALRFSIINQTAKRQELEAFLPEDTAWKTTYFILPPLASDGLGYNFYLLNDSLGRFTSVNDIASIRVYKLPVSELINIRYATPEFSNFNSRTTHQNLSFTHPNSSYYKFTTSSFIENSTIVLSQAYNPGWKAYEVDSRLGETFPFLFGKELPNHVLVNNWANGWEISEGNSNTIVIFFLPQLLQWVGFGLLPVPFLLLLLKRKV